MADDADDLAGRHAAAVDALYRFFTRLPNAERASTILTWIAELPPDLRAYTDVRGWVAMADVYARLAALGLDKTDG